MSHRRMPRGKRTKVRIKVDSLPALAELEAMIRRELQGFSLDGLLWTLGENSALFQPFVAAGFASLALKSCTPSQGNFAPVPVAVVHRLEPLVINYLSADPIIFDREVHDHFRRTNPVFLLIRIMGSQFPYHINVFETYARSLLLFDEIPRQIKNPDFDLDSAFRANAGCSVLDFVRTAFLSYLMAKEKAGFSSRTFGRWKNNGVLMPPLPEVRIIMRQIAASPKEFNAARSLDEGIDPRFRIYRLNPLFRYPVIRPWGDEPSSISNR